MSAMAGKVSLVAGLVPTVYPVVVKPQKPWLLSTAVYVMSPVCAASSM